MKQDPKLSLQLIEFVIQLIGLLLLPVDKCGPLSTDLFPRVDQLPGEDANGGGALGPQIFQIIHGVAVSEARHCVPQFAKGEVVGLV